MPSKEWREKNRERYLASRRQHYQKNKEKIRGWQKKNYEKHRLERLAYGQQYYEEHKEKLLAYNHKYHREHREQIKARNKQRREKHKDKILTREAVYRKKNPEKRRAAYLANDHVPLGLKCEICGSTENLERHHPDYSKPLEVVTLCRSCHHKIHSSETFPLKLGLHRRSTCRRNTLSFLQTKPRTGGFS